MNVRATPRAIEINFSYVRQIHEKSDMLVYAPNNSELLELLITLTNFINE